MANAAIIEEFIKKYRLAQTSKSKDFRITIEEAGDLVAWIAMINSNQSKMDNMTKKLDLIAELLKKLPEPESAPIMNGGGFK